jgi:hypothetical protein
MSEMTRSGTVLERRTAENVKWGAIGGVVAGLVFALVTMAWTAAQGAGALAAFTMIASIPYGGTEPQALTGGTIVLGLAIHMVLSIVYGVLFAWLLPRRASAGVAYGIGAAFGLALYLVNFPLLGNLVFPVFLMAHQVFEVLLHIAFGILLVPFARRASA